MGNSFGCFPENDIILIARYMPEQGACSVCAVCLCRLFCCLFFIRWECIWMCDLCDVIFSSRNCSRLRHNAKSLAGIRFVDDVVAMKCLCRRVIDRRMVVAYFDGMLVWCFGCSFGDQLGSKSFQHKRDKTFFKWTTWNPYWGGLLLYRLTLSVFARTIIFLIFFFILSLIAVDVFWIVSFWIAKCDIWTSLVLLNVDGLVEEIVDDVVFGRLLTGVIVWWWHTYQMHLMELETFRANPWVLLVLLTVVEHLATHALVGIVSARWKANSWANRYFFLHSSHIATKYVDW